ncbi:hypothetical protein G7076_08630 [Sphingomonas sp. HDW15A]|uniref:hypothetical protein n=1 Tax=Sphingomonas sp. HDW15A TaxID=2714942 RepID=UPI00140A7946|nr:hypothetical protein [Sphingomonas sp. HDW15A]QIK96493.1 hypothetical protein G7076_08630 [Sphingomonas sp. HDW15A]
MANRALRDAELRILNAPFEDRGWERAIEAIAEATGSHAAQLLGIGGPMLIPLNVFVGAPASYRHYIESAHLHGPCNWRVGSTTVPMAIQHEEHYQAYRLTHQTSDYDDAASEMDIPFGCQSAIVLDQNNLIGLALLRGRRDGPCDAEVLERFAHLRHQMGRAVQMQIALDGEASQLMIGNLDTLHGATVLLDRHGCIAALTPAAETMFADDRPLRLSGISVALQDRGENARLAASLARMLRNEVTGGVEQIRIGRSAQYPKGQWRLFVTRLPQRDDHGLGFEPHIALTIKAAG